MARDKSQAQMLFDDMVKHAVTPVLKPIGFRKSGLNFHRRHKEVVQVVNFQSSHGSTWGEKLFYVNVGIAFDDLCRLRNIEILEKPKEHECSSRGRRDRMEVLFPSAPERWKISLKRQPDVVEQQMKECMQELSEELQKIDSISAYRQHPWFDRFRPRGMNAQIMYLLEDFDGAWQEVTDLCTAFAGRDGLSDPEWRVKDLGLVELAARVDSADTRDSE
jgi:hypothetical protein